MYLKSLKFFINIIPPYMFRTPLCPSSGASQLHMQSLVPINYKNTCCLQLCHYVHFIITTNVCVTRINRFLNSVLVLYCFVFSFGSVGFVSCIILLLHTVWCLVRCVLQSCCVVTAAFCFLYYTVVTYRVVLGSLCPPVLLCCNCCFFVCLWVGIDFLVP